MSCPFCQLDHAIEVCPALTPTTTAVAAVPKAAPLDSPAPPPRPPMAAPAPPPAPTSATAAPRKTFEVRYAHGMNFREYNGLTRYTGATYKAMNAILRNRNVGKHIDNIMEVGGFNVDAQGEKTLARSGAQEYIALLIAIVTGMAKIPKWTKTQHTLRGSKNFSSGTTKVFDEMKALAATYKQGNRDGSVWFDNGFLSTTASKTPFAASGDGSDFILFVCMLPDVAHGGRCIKELSQYGEEAEVLFMPGQEFYVVHTDTFSQPCHKNLVTAELQSKFGLIVYMVAKPLGYTIGNAATTSWATAAKGALGVHVAVGAGATL